MRPQELSMWSATPGRTGTGILRLHALDVTTGQEKFGGPVTMTGTVSGSGAGSTKGVLTFNPVLENQRSGLLLLNGVVYVGFSAHMDGGNWHGLILAYDAGDLHQTGAFCVTPNGIGGGVWMSGAGLAADQLDPAGHAFGRMFVPTGNGDYDAAKQNYSESDLHLDLAGGNPVVTDAFTPQNQAALTNDDLDLDAGGLLILPTQTTGVPHVLIQAGKTGTIYVLNRDNLGGYHTSGDQILQELSLAVGDHGVWGSPAYWNGNIYYWGQSDYLKQFALVNGLLTTNPIKSVELLAWPGATPSVSANGATNGIVWSIDASRYVNGGAAVLRAHDATNVGRTLYSSIWNAARDSAGPAVKFAVPTIANGRVYVGTATELDVYGLLGISAPTFSPAPGAFNQPVHVTITDATAGATIYYTTDGSLPSTASLVYSGPITVSNTRTIRAMAVAPGYSPSTVTSATYTIGSISAPPPLVDYSAGFASSAGLFLVGASVSNGALLLTDGSLWKARAAWYATPVNVQSFTTDFTFQATAAAGDGFTFTIQNAGKGAYGSMGDGLGYAGIRASVAVKFDLYNNSGEGSDSTGFYINGAEPATPALDMTSSGVNLHSGDTMAVHLAYDGRDSYHDDYRYRHHRQLHRLEGDQHPGNRRRECRLRRLHCRYR